jgi:transketolase
MQKKIEQKISGNIYGNKLAELGAVDDRIVVIEADLMKASGSNPFKKRFPNRHFNVGVAEQNLIGVAAGFAAMNKIPFASTFACFAAQRSCDQVMISAAYNNFNVKIVGSYAGLTSEKNGGTHISIADIAIFRVMPNFTVLVPGDCCELAGAIEAAARMNGPVYIRMARTLPTDIFEQADFVIGKAKVIADGDEVTLITTGITTYEAMKACQTLYNKGIRVHHLHMPTIKPLDKDAIISSAKRTGGIVTVENHSVIGGLGSAVAEAVSENYPVPMKRMGMQDCFGETAKLDYLLDKFEISSGHIAAGVEKFLRKDRKCLAQN